MQRSLQRLIVTTGFSAFAVTAFVGSVTAQVQQPATPARPALSQGMQLLISRLRLEFNSVQYAETLRTEFFQLDANADGTLGQPDVDLHEAIEATQARYNNASSVMRFDLNGDGAVTEDEIRAVMRYNSRGMLGAAAANPNNAPSFAEAYRQAETTVQTVMASDADKDGKVTYTEAANTLRLSPRPNRENTPSGRTQQALTLEATSNGSLALNDFLVAGEALYRKLDSNGDGTVSQQELVDFWRAPTSPDASQLTQAKEAILTRDPKQGRVRSQPTETANLRQGSAGPAGCAMPPPSAKAKLLLLSIYQTEALSSVALGSQDAVVHAGRVTVEAGDEPLYVVIPTYSAVIWQFSGAVERIERLVMSSSVTGPSRGNGNPPSLVGATGIPANRIAFLGQSGCFGHFSEIPSSQSVQTTATIRQAVGRQPDLVATAYSLIGFSIPSGKTESARNARERARMLGIEKVEGSTRVDGSFSSVIARAKPSRIRNDLFDTAPGGLLEIDSKSVVSSVPAEPYEVYPQEAGLLQLLDNGTLTQNRSGEYIVQKKTRFPAGLAGGHSVKFVVPRGIPIPEGDPSHSCVVAEERTPAGNDNCR